MGGGGCSGRQRRDSRRRKTERDTGRDPRDKQISEHTMQFSGSMPLAALSSPSVFLSLPPSAPLLLFQPPLTHSLSLLYFPLPSPRLFFSLLLFAFATSLLLLALYLSFIRVQAPPFYSAHITPLTPNPSSIPLSASFTLSHI